MITYEPFWNFLKKKKISTYKLIYTYGINSYTINRLKHNKPLKTSTIDNLCNRLHCDITDIMGHIAEDWDEYTPGGRD